MQVCFLNGDSMILDPEEGLAAAKAKVAQRMGVLPRDACGGEILTEMPAQSVLQDSRCYAAASREPGSVPFETAWEFIRQRWPPVQNERERFDRLRGQWMLKYQELRVIGQWDVQSAWLDLDVERFRLYKEETLFSRAVDQRCESLRAELRALAVDEQGQRELLRDFEQSLDSLGPPDPYRCFCYECCGEAGELDSDGEDDGPPWYNQDHPRGSPSHEDCKWERLLRLLEQQELEDGVLMDLPHCRRQTRPPTRRKDRRSGYKVKGTRRSRWKRTYKLESSALVSECDV